ncbi:MAG: TfoX/Sxy family protein [Rhodobacterales bacterium]|nr:TfoX/Sxy family protein [Rhodobacterales bacterium]
MAINPDVAAHVEDLLAPLGPVAVRRMFGGGGVFLDGLMLGLIVDDTLYFKTDDGNRAAYDAAGMAPFRFTRAGKLVETSLLEVPPDLLDDADALLPWAQAALDAARRSAAKKPAKKRK